MFFLRLEMITMLSKRSSDLSSQNEPDNLTKLSTIQWRFLKQFDDDEQLLWGILNSFRQVQIVFFRFRRHCKVDRGLICAGLRLT